MKEAFFDFEEQVYLNCAAQGPFPKVTVDAIRNAIQLKSNPYTIEDTIYFDLPARVRKRAARLIGARPEEIALSTGASHGINIAANGLPLTVGDEILVADREFPANVYPWLNQEKRGVKTRIIKPEGRFITPEDFERNISPRTKVIAVSFVNYANGYRADLKFIGKLCKNYNIYFVVDGSQGVGGVPINVKELGIDIMAVAGYKWLLSPYGSGFVYVRDAILEKISVPEVNWARIKGAEDFNSLLKYKLEFCEGAPRFDYPETANFLNNAAMEASLNFLLNVGVKKILAHCQSLLDYLIENLPQDKFQIISSLQAKHRSNFLSISAQSPEDTAAAFRRLKEGHVHVSLREDALRISPHVYNNRENIDKLCELLSGNASFVSQHVLVSGAAHRKELRYR
ncbi:MAG: aminotransferase class V-fold PLP-dependent enzyme [bacterium]